VDEVDHLAAALPAREQADLAPLRGLLLERRRREQRRMVRVLGSARATAAIDEWEAFLGGLVASPGEARPDAARPIAAIAGGRIMAVHRRMMRDGARIDDASPPEAFHDLRKVGKELRYLLELFASLYPEDAVGQLVRALKGLQDSLGRFQDREVQAGVLRSLRDRLVGREGGPAALMAMGQLVQRIEEDQAAARSEFAERFAAFSSKRQRALVRGTFG
jgi:CHAD domain-containing protein